ncbi:uncharacterized protein PgNI_08014 [Pyricularia grisea]|uniref:Uncharacterized protein n=1 Tax=Pyricularia grisea TaxID=148305 RepID=A0A6P8AWQ7_PYRGI|nr:uncharacterized protein PgNI_08014 [Pyricularia grisea]TLD06609.1 hypothetical protein PgNI_08014 [Pyricularia grisea]
MAVWLVHTDACSITKPLGTPVLPEVKSAYTALDGLTADLSTWAAAWDGRGGWGGQGKPGLGLTDDHLLASRRVRGVERDPGTTGLVDGQDRDEKPRRLVEAHMHQLVRMHVELVRQMVGEAVGLVVELGVCKLTVPRTNRKGVWPKTSLFFKQLMEARVHNLRVVCVPGFELVQLGGADKIQVRKSIRTTVLGTLDQLVDGLLKLADEASNLGRVENGRVVRDSHANVLAAIGEMRLEDQGPCASTLHRRVDRRGFVR